MKYPLFDTSRRDLRAEDRVYATRMVTVDMYTSGESEAPGQHRMHRAALVFAWVSLWQSLFGGCVCGAIGLMLAMRGSDRSRVPHSCVAFPWSAIGALIGLTVLVLILLYVRFSINW